MQQACSSNHIHYIYTIWTCNKNVDKVKVSGCITQEKSVDI